MKFTEIASHCNVKYSFTNNQITYDKSKVLALTAALTWYILHLNIPILLGTVDILTPLYALSTAVVVGVVQWAMWKVFFQRNPPPSS